MPELNLSRMKLDIIQAFPRMELVLTLKKKKIHVVHLRALIFPGRAGEAGEKINSIKYSRREKRKQRENIAIPVSMLTRTQSTALCIYTRE